MRVRKLKSRFTTSQTHRTRLRSVDIQFWDLCPRGDGSRAKTATPHTEPPHPTLVVQSAVWVQTTLAHSFCRKSCPRHAQPLNLGLSSNSAVVAPSEVPETFFYNLQRVLRLFFSGFSPFSAVFKRFSTVLNVFWSVSKHVWSVSHIFSTFSIVYLNLTNLDTILIGKPLTDYRFKWCQLGVPKWNS